MPLRIASSYLFVALLVSGCARPFFSGAMIQAPGKSIGKTITTATAPLRHSWRRIAKSEQSKLPPWDWATGIPDDAPRAELLATDVPNETLASLFPEAPGLGVQLVSTDASASSMRIANVGGREVHNCADLYDATSRNSGNEPVQVDLRAANGREIAVRVTPIALQNLASSTVTKYPVLRAADGGSACLVVREAGVCGKVVTRAERSRGLLQIVLSCRALDNREVLLPREVRAACGGQPLQCLTVSETLDVLYGSLPAPKETTAANSDPSCFSFSAVSSRADYLIPVNYKRLCDKLEVSNIAITDGGTKPAFASIPGASYPGPAILGDARALTGILLQPQVMSAKDEEKTGWIVFAGEPLKRGGVVNIDVDFGTGMRTLRFNVPAP
jgi:hypothetical protein